MCGAICAALSSELCANNNKFIPSAVAGAASFGGARVLSRPSQPPATRFGDEADVSCGRRGRVF